MYQFEGIKSLEKPHSLKQKVNECKVQRTFSFQLGDHCHPSFRTVAKDHSFIPSAPGKWCGSRGRKVNSELRWKLARWQQSHRQHQHLPGKLLRRWFPGGGSAQNLAARGRSGRKTEPSEIWYIWECTGPKDLVSFPVQHKFPALTRLLLMAKLEKLHDSKGRKTNGKCIYIGNCVLLMLQQN